MPVLYVGNYNYSSWSMRPWLVLKWAGISFETKCIPLGGTGYGDKSMPAVLDVSPTGTVPSLHVNGVVIADSLAVSEWAAEQVSTLWPEDSLVRAKARAAACEMHSGFAALRTSMPCNIRRRRAAQPLSADAQRDVQRVNEVWNAHVSEFGGPYLFGKTPCIADAFYTPVATRFRTYGLPLSSYAETLLKNPAFLEWETMALAEIYSMPQWDSA